jgi:acyl-coenzyme A thioesterase PaaI-like protein
MKIVELIGIKREENTLPALKLSENNQNHIGTMHAGAQFILAEMASGVYLSKLFPELKDKIIPLLRESKIKYKKTALGTITTHPYLSYEEKEQFKNQFLKKSRATIEVEVTLKNENNEIVSIGSFRWFIQKRE